MAEKTWKREHATLFSVILAYQILMDNTQMVELILSPVLLFIGSVAGLHIYKGKTNAAGS